MRPVRSVATCALVAALAAGCAGVESNRNAASVGGTDVTIEDYESLLREFAANPEITQLEENVDTGTVAGDDGRRWLTLLVQGAASTEFLEREGEPVTDEDRRAVRDQIPENDPVLGFSDATVSLLVDQQAGSAARARIVAPDADELERRYTSSPASIGLMCVRHVLVETEAEAEDVLDALADGADIETLAVERSTDQAAAQNGGAIEGADGPCIPLAAGRQQLDPAFAVAAMESAPGSPAGPVQTSFGWHVIEARPWAEVADSVDALYREAAGDLLFTGFLATEEVAVDPRYGRWDGASSSVVAL